ncbi:CDP-alcohol phosphatidyltransferase family protein [Actinobacteria bacterium YIM 96077]|uniref:CDP-alcohol phosphatidyltransferase family protein n=1 Tax=Phytoactinopolyspora halophila TaxID=1981511 RepID=A0A329R042_9ACTN|nr:CDP-alcohol phosphatidyltransferase family protein [Phytoactinopolyspora halophila]AYY13237.1 CDP-alcohol phosphatidyltransferase family protein [Actinobacteria bacterium YIM 96077]RAW17526.1 CDP-alcohol phosphatidyltransferase family protein [Phytoactinopolyspora halophila]
MDVQETGVRTNRIFTIPNLLSLLRLLGVPLFLWLILVEERDFLALAILAFAGFSDYLDGKLARRWNQVSKLGETLDPLADRLYILTTVGAFTIREIIPLWFAILLVSRDAFLVCLVPFLRRRGLFALPVHFLGKAATFCLLYAFPLLLLSIGEGTLPMLAQVFGWAFAIWGVALYWWAGILYAEQVRRVLRETSA